MKRIISILILTSQLICCNSKRQALNTNNSVKADSNQTIDYADTIRKILALDTLTQIEIQEIIKINPDLKYIIYQVSDGVSLGKYVVTFSQNKFRDYETLDKTTDQDFANPYYAFTELKDTSNNEFLIANYILQADKAFLNSDSTFKTGYNFENSRINSDSNLVRLSFKADGSIKRDTVRK